MRLIGWFGLPRDADVTSLSKRPKQFQKSAPLSEIDNLTKELRAYTDDIKAWMKENQVKLNDDKLHRNPPPFPSLTRLLSVVTTSLPLILLGTLESFLTQNCP